MIRARFFTIQETILHSSTRCNTLIYIHINQHSSSNTGSFLYDSLSISRSFCDRANWSWRLKTRQRSRARAETRLCPLFPMQGSDGALLVAADTRVRKLK